MCREFIQESISSFSRWHSIVSYQWESDDQYLTPVRGIRDGLWIAYHAGLKDQFTSDASISSKAEALI
jgi:hypothetical protein